MNERFFTIMSYLSDRDMMHKVEIGDANRWLVDDYDDRPYMRLLLSEEEFNRNYQFLVDIDKRCHVKRDDKMRCREGHEGHSDYYELFWPLCAVKKGEHPWDDITLVWPK